MNGISNGLDREIRLKTLARFSGFWLASAGFVFMCLCLITGCSHIMRGQSPDSEAMEFNDDIDSPVYVGDVAGPIGLQKLKVDGIALVTQLDGTGSEPQPSGQRDLLIEEIKTHEIDDISSLLAGKDTSMALVTGSVPPGARKGDRFDVVVRCIQRSKTTSLEGGFTMQVRMKPFVAIPNDISFGHNWGVARGHVVVDSFFDSSEDAGNKIRGLIPGGGTVTRDRICGIQIVNSERSIRRATAISRAINKRFSARIQGRPEGVADPKNDERIEVEIAEGYQTNVGRYFHVLFNIVFEETDEQLVNRMERLERDLHNPEKTSIASIRLEAIGEDARNILNRGLRSDDFAVQFHSAQALAYMGDNSGVGILKKAADEEPAFRWHALTALASVKDSVSEDALASLFSSDSAEARYGAFRALRDSIPESLAVDGELVGREFMLHTVVSDSKPMIHLSRTKVPEVVLFGGNQHFNEELLYFKSGLTVKADGASRIVIKRYLPNGKEQQVVCSTLISDVIRQMVEVGAGYGDVIRLLKDAGQTNAMDSNLVINAVPQLSNSYRNARAELSDKYVSEKIPEMFDDSSSDESETSKSGKGIFRDLW